MAILSSTLAVSSAQFASDAGATLALLERVRAIEKRAHDRSAASRERFEQRGQLLPRERVGLLLDPGASFLELCSLAGYCRDKPDPDRSVAGAGLIAGIGMVSGVRCVVVASDAGIDAGALQPVGLDKLLRLQEIALESRLPYLQLLESAGANLLDYRVEDFVRGGELFRNLARLSAAGLPVITVTHGSSTAGGAYQTGLSDVIILVRDRSRVFLAGPPLLRAATGEIATEEDLGGALMHTTVSGLGDHLAEDDRDAIRIAREVVAALPDAFRPPDRRGTAPGLVAAPEEAAVPTVDPPRYSAEELLGIIPADGRRPVDMREVIARIVDGSDFLPFSEGYGAATVCGHARLNGIAIGIISNNGPIDESGASKAAHFIQVCCQSGTPIVYLVNTTGFMVGRQVEQAGIVKHGSRMVQAVANATVPQITITCGASFGAGNYGMCGRGFAPRFHFSWPCARTAVMGAEQAAGTMRIVTEAAMRRKGQVDTERLDAMSRAIVERFESQTSVFATSALLLDDGVIDPRDTRDVLALVLAIVSEAEARSLRAIQFSVARS
jgi:geranyl-CoA carboxylase beta subunit